MKKIISFILAIITSVLFDAQMSSSIIPISQTVSSNGRYKLKSISYDDEFPTLRGKSFVISTHDYDENGYHKKLYEINRAFDLYEGYPLFVAISNDGQKVAYFKEQVYFEGEEHKNITYYVKGEFIKAYTTEEFINCNTNEEKCKLFYNNNTIEDYKRSSSTVAAYKRNTTEKEKYLSKNFIFNKNDTVYIIDNRQKITLFDLNNNKIIKTKIDFDSIYPQIKDFETIKSQIFYYNEGHKYINDFENSLNNEKLSKTISDFTKLKYIESSDSTYHKYKLFTINLSGYLDHKGKFEIESFECDSSIFNKTQVEDYIKKTIFKEEFVPEEVEKQYFHYFFGGYRSFDNKTAEQETLKDKEKRKQEFKKRLALQKIDGIYIPENLYECMTELDKILNFESKKQLKESMNTFEFNSHLGGLGMWIRNNWGINGGSRLLKYFNDRGIGKKIFGNDEISGIIIENYIQWLKGNKNSWKLWEEKNPKK